MDNVVQSAELKISNPFDKIKNEVNHLANSAKNDLNQFVKGAKKELEHDVNTIKHTAKAAKEDLKHDVDTIKHTADVAKDELEHDVNTIKHTAKAAKDEINHIVNAAKDELNHDVKAIEHAANTVKNEVEEAVDKVLDELQDFQGLFVKAVESGLIGKCLKTSITELEKLPILPAIYTVGFEFLNVGFKAEIDEVNERLPIIKGYAKNPPKGAKQIEAMILALAPTSFEVTVFGNGPTYTADQIDQVIAYEFGKLGLK